jgi:SPP1 family holin
MQQIPKITAGTVIRFLVLLLALVNQSLIMAGNPPLPIDEGQISSAVESLYLGGSIVVSVVAAIVAYWKDNDVTKKARVEKQETKI